jgi:hypothetical protein
MSRPGRNEIASSEIIKQVTDLFYIMIERATWDDRMHVLMAVRKAIKKLWLDSQNVRLSLMRAIYGELQNETWIDTYIDDLAQVVESIEHLNTVRSLKYQIDAIVEKLEAERQRELERDEGFDQER